MEEASLLDSHALGLEESCNGSRLFTDAYAVFVRNKSTAGRVGLGWESRFGVGGSGSTQIASHRCHQHCALRFPPRGETTCQYDVAKGGDVVAHQPPFD